MAVRLHGVNISAVEQRLIGVGIVFLYFFDQLVLTHHGPPRS